MNASADAVAARVLYAQGPVHVAFGLSYAAYHVVPRRTLQSMPEDWQARFVALMAEARQRLPDEAFPEYQVIRICNGRFQTDPHRQYRRAGPLPLFPAGAAPAESDAPLAGAFVNTDNLVRRRPHAHPVKA